MPIARFSLYTGMGAAIWCSVLTSIGWYLGRQVEVLRSEDFRRYSSRAALTIVPILMVIVAVYVYFQRRKTDRNAYPGAGGA
jgi:membrane protein DedA with SNARE-associated domain